ncbi:unnamed protein product [Candida verbasci]|uniref:Nucleolar 27S pre-rRNA processing Urb2/Npa2 C-terminal domain-containing protein n=1 Tax=Candida verbasci TaxID=1227364 RepID=A0A9W4XAZ0_9ASCO|nr:unnamed protein product [Candida verbasci]
MTELSSAESLTKFIRSKDGNIDKIANISNDLINDKLDVYLPNKNSFILSLLIDRINDKSSNQFSKWKYNRKIWSLLIKVYDLIDEKKEIQRLKIIEVAIILLQNNGDCLEAVFEVMELCLKHSYIEIDENLAIQLLKMYVLNVNKTTMKYSDLIQIIYVNTTSKLSLDGSKKLNTKFFEECCFPLVEYLSSHERTNLESILIKELFNANSIQYLAPNLNKVLEKQDLDSTSIVYLYKLIVDQLSSSHMSVCEACFNAISAKYPKLSEQLLSILASSRKTISTEFIEKIYKNEIKDKQFKDLNWSMVKYIFEIDNEIATKKSSFLFKKYNSGFELDDLVLPVSEVIVDSYLKSRELVEFLTEVWPRAIKKDELWESSRFINIVSKTIKSLSNKQLNSVIELVFKMEEENSQRTIFEAITEGLIESNNALIDSVKESFINNSEFFNSGKDEFWHIRYNLLCLYGVDYEMSKVLLNEVDYDLYFHYNIFRLIELRELEEVSVARQRQFLSFINDDENVKLISSIFDRWMIIFNNYFNQETNKQLIEIALTAGVFDNPNPLLFEQPKLTTILIQTIFEKLSDNLFLIIKIPIVSFNKNIKKELINELYNLSIKNKDGALQQLQYLLQHPTNQSELEIYFDAIIELLKASNAETKGLTFEICESIWINHVKQIKNADNLKFIEGSISNLLEYFENNDTKKISPEIEFTLTILSNSNTIELSELVQLREIFTRICISNLQNSDDLYSINWYLWALTMVKPNNIKLQNILSGLNNEVKLNPLIQKTIFKFICATLDANYTNSIFILSLFIALGFNDIYEDLRTYLKRLSVNEQDYKKSFEIFIQSSTDSTDSIDLSIQISCAFLTTTTKQFELPLAPCFNLFNNSYASVLLILDTLKSLLVEKAWIFNQYLLEFTLSLISSIIHKSSTFENSELIYIKSSQVISHILLYHRYKLSTRHNLLINLISSFFTPLTKNQPLGHSLNAADSFIRLLSNLCEPQERSKEVNLTTQSDLFKKSLRKHLPILLTNYIFLNLRFNFDKLINDILKSGIFVIFDVLSQTELKSVNAALDYAGRSFYKTLYADYEDHGKWKDN